MLLNETITFDCMQFLSHDQVGDERYSTQLNPVALSLQQS